MKFTKVGPVNHPDRVSIDGKISHVVLTAKHADHFAAVYWEDTIHDVKASDALSILSKAVVTPAKRGRNKNMSTFGR